MRIVLTAVDRDLLDAWKESCASIEGVVVHKGSILEVDCDAIVSPGNSFGFMDGGIDLIYSSHFGKHVQERLQKLIRTRHQGELLVGTAEIIETDDQRIPFLIAAPTMRVPMVLRTGVNPYLAARAALLLIKNGKFPTGSNKGEPVENLVETVAFPGLGTGVGGVSPKVCARQFRAAIEDVVLEKLAFPRSWSDAQNRHQLMYTNSTRDLQYDDEQRLGIALRRAERFRQKLRNQRARIRKRWQ